MATATLFRACGVLALLVGLLGAPIGAAADPIFVQAGFTEVRGSASVDTPFPGPTTAGNVIVAYVIWSNTSPVALSDAHGNQYAAATAPVAWTGGSSAQVFVAAESASGTNHVTATFGAPVDAYGLLYVHEYAGLDAANPIDAATAGSGGSGTLDSGALVTSNPNDLLFAAGASSAAVTAAGADFTPRSTGSGNLTADRTVGAAGTYEVTASQDGEAWVMQLVALRAAGQAPAAAAVPDVASAPPPDASAPPDVSAPPPDASAPPAPDASAAPAPTEAPAPPTPTPAPVPANAAPAPAPVANPGPAAFPIGVSGNHRYLVDATGKPFLMVGDSPQSLIGNLSEADADAYFANRQKDGFNAVWINLLCNNYTYCSSNGATFDGIQPFTTPEDLSTPNPAYFARVDRMLQLAANHGLVVLLDPIETGGWYTIMANNGPTRDFNYGQFLGNRYKNVPNIIWMSGNDYQGAGNDQDAFVAAVAKGIKSVDPGHLQTIELNYNRSNGTDDPNWLPILGLNSAYTYYPTFDYVLRGYNNPNTMPVFMVEANYESEHNFTDQGSPPILRRQEYWTLLSGATGQLYGNLFTVRFQNGWKSNLDTPGARQLQIQTSLFAPREWYNLTPDQNHTVLTGGVGNYDANTTLANSDYATAARTPDGKLVIAYMPTRRTFTVDMSKLSGPVTARWFDPSNGAFTSIGVGLPNSGAQQFTPPGNNADGDGDWVLLLEAGS